MKSRRDFLTQMAAAGTAVFLAPALGCAKEKKQSIKVSPGEKTTPSKKARVVLVQCPGISSDGPALNRSAVRRMLEKGLCELYGTDDTRAALANWLRPVDTVGLKVNCMAGRQMCSHSELVEELVSLMGKMGLPRKQAIVFDRSDRDLQRGGFPIRTSGNDYLCMGNDRAGFEKNVRVMPNGASRFSKVATEKASALINIPVLKDHGLAGLTVALKNNFGLIHNPNKFHLNGCDPHVAEVNALDFVQKKQRLVICDAFRVQTNGGPAFNPASADVFDGLLFANDPVALDMVAWEILKGLREKRSLPSLQKENRPPVHILTSAKHGLGIADRERIEFVKAKIL
ncbi:MAG: DUF362 domain-containing protein [Pseudomonadota bacterium]